MLGFFSLCEETGRWWSLNKCRNGGWGGEEEGLGGDMILTQTSSVIRL